MFLMDTSNPIAYMKTTNAMGQSTLRCFKLVEFDMNNIKTNDASSPEYALKSDLDVLVNKVDNLLSRLEKTSKTNPVKSDKEV